MWKVWFRIVDGNSVYVGRFEKEYVIKGNASKLAKKLAKKTGYETIVSVENPFAD